ncbi:hypothetical protein [uncultured Tateyamaria sp.]|uniref:hypothetical protein n=1 Tax=uncultured Tateyamaria sp. TaxID=455651 RepID=UPI00262EDA3D|nr:hypothetical protein [uncultured Tateyamaria sp.]
MITALTARAATVRRDTCAACVALICAATSVSAQPIGASGAAEQTIQYVIVDQYIEDVFAMIERDTGLRIRPSEAVRARVQRHTLTGPVLPALTGLAAAHNLDLFEFGGTVHVSAKDETALRLVRLKGVSKDRALAALSDAGLQFAPGDVREAATGMALTLTGPPRMLAIAEAIVESIPPLTSPASNIRVRRGVSMGLEAVNAPAASDIPQIAPVEAPAPTQLKAES